MQRRQRAEPFEFKPIVETGDIADIYNRAGDQYIRYADGDPEHLFCFEGLHAYADRRVWAILEKKLNELRATGRGAIRILDAGCGPGTWLRRCVTHAYRLGFSQIAARGFDVAEVQIETAPRMTAELAELQGVQLTFEVADLTERLREPDASVDICLCLYSVLSHLPVLTLPQVASEIARVTDGYFLTTVRAIGSAPTAFVSTIEETRHLQLDHARNRCQIELRNGKQMDLSFHLFTAAELRQFFSKDFQVEELQGLDIFHSRFLPDRRWNPPSLANCDPIAAELAAMEEAYARDARFMERAMHLLLVGCRRGPKSAEYSFCSAPIDDAQKRRIVDPTQGETRPRAA
jgi:SAM-dependent methyltransferase